MRSNPLVDRLMSKVQFTAYGCWEWNGYVDPKGYGRMGVYRRVEQAHRMAYVLFVGPIPEGLEIDHLCRNRRCVLPEHLEAVTRKENMRRGLQSHTAGRNCGVTIPVPHNALKTHCPRGHSYAEHAWRDTYGWRRCLACKREREGR